jgi:tripartite-type tricarboxylate transporter receptor subunit TctC
VTSKRTKHTCRWFGLRLALGIALVRDLFLAASLTLIAVGATQAQSFPDKPVRIVVPYGAGGGTDQLARLLAERLSNRWGKSVTVENKAGADGVIGTDAVGKSPADGHTLALVVGSHTVNSFFNKSMPFDPVKDFVPVTLVAYSPIAMVVTPQMAVNTAQELVAKLKANEGKNTYGSSEKVTRLSGELFSQETGGKMTYVPYKGGAQLMGDMLGGHTDIGFTSMLTVIQHHRAGKLKVLTVGSEKRHAALPDVPTMTEAGYAAASSVVWYGLIAPRAVPKAIVDKIQSDVAAVLGEASVKELIDRQGGIPVGNTSEQFSKIIQDDARRWARVVKAAGIQPE